MVSPAPPAAAAGGASSRIVGRIGSIRGISSASRTRGSPSQQPIAADTFTATTTTSSVYPPFEPSANAQRALARCQQRQHSGTITATTTATTATTSRFINFIMETGEKRALMERHVRDGMLVLHRRTQQNPHALFERCVEMLAPVLEVASCRQRAKMHRVPIPVTEYRGQSIAFRWLKEALQKKRRPPQPFPEKFASEVLAVLEGKSPLLQKRSQMHKEALVNRSAAPMRWGVGYQL